MEIVESEAMHMVFVNAIPEALVCINQEGRITLTNHHLDSLFGYAHHDLIGQKMSYLIYEYDRSPETHYRETFGQRQNGDIFPLELHLSPLITADGHFTLAIVHDVTARVKQTQLLNEKDNELQLLNIQLNSEKGTLERTNKKLLLVAELSELLIACKNEQEMVALIASYTSQILDFCFGVLYLVNSSDHQLNAVTTWGVMGRYETNFIMDDCCGARRGVIHEINASGLGVSCDHIKQLTPGHTYVCVPVRTLNETFGLIYLEIEDVYLSSEYHPLVNMLSRTIAAAIANLNLCNMLRDQSIHDALTGLYNRRFLDEYLMKQIFHAQRKNYSLAVIMFDIDDFKTINDTHGHEAGDRVLEKLGRLMTGIIRADDVACRFGGDEFICILQNCSLDLAQKRAEDFRREIHDMIKAPFPPAITVSLGLSVYPKDGTTPSELIDKADKALYKAKQAGKNKIVTSLGLVEYV